MKEVTITIKTTYSAQCRAIDEHSITAYADDRFPGLAIHAPWDFFTDTWRVTHVPSGLAVAILPTRAAATAALELIGKLQNWNRPQAEVAAHGEPGEARWLKVAVAAAVEQVNRERAAALRKPWKWARSRPLPWRPPWGTSVVTRWAAHGAAVPPSHMAIGQPAPASC